MAAITRAVPEGLRTGDRIDCDVRGIMPIFTRLFSCGGIAHAFDHSRATHTGMVVIWQGKAFVLEMTGRGIAFHSFAEAYLDRWDARIIQFVRHPAFDDASARAELEVHASAALGEHVRYDFPGIFGFVDKRIKDDPKRDYCSEMYYQMTRDRLVTFGSPYSSRFEERVSPYDLQRCAGPWQVFYRYGGPS